MITAWAIYDNTTVRKYAQYRCRLRNKVIGTKFEPRILCQTGTSTSFLAQIVTLRFAWYLPWYRQEQIMAGQGFLFQRSTMARWSNRIAYEVLKDIYDRLADDVLSRSSRLFADETLVEQLDPGRGKTRPELHVRASSR
ncbi:IS66 family transposase [Falsirhodobacter sp. 20TX0035]|uniref:IS66 family transposase n=1 Tax=Falsirhodobacter sp. 20TX0035 TaxID=3022019 RepID=UPI00232B3319|nr:transposase [Falsirhodobacter sp. 20TX0035]MDB6454144.1 transposase [Falsirhodobacter sp. 20TX0035]